MSRLAGETIERSRAIRTLLDTAPRELPVSADAARAFDAALRRAPEKDPKRYVRALSELCWRLAVYADDEDWGIDWECGSYDVELWTDGSADFLVCGCSTVHVDGKPVDSTLGLRPARRSEVLFRHPGAELCEPGVVVPSGGSTHPP
ncbi:MAG: hypothetical protein AAGF12_40400 [Myxococcota bacterium]